MILLFLLHVLSLNSYDLYSGPPPAQNIRERIAPPRGYTWVTEPKGSFGEYLQNSPLKPKGAKILDHNQSPISNQHEHIAILDYDIGHKNLLRLDSQEIIHVIEFFVFHEKSMAAKP